MALEIVKNKKAPTKDEIKGRLIFGPIMIIGGLALILFASYPKLQKANETHSWQQTQGTIKSTWITAHKDGHDKRDKEHLDHYASDEGNKFRVDFEYEYTVNNKTYTCRKRDIMQSKKEGYAKYARATRKMNKLLNNEVTVHYNPANPSEAVLQPGLKLLQWLLVVSPLILVIVGLPITFSGIKLTLFPPDPSQYTGPKTFSSNFKKAE